MKTIEDEFTDLFVSHTKALGLPELHSKIVARLYVEPDALSMEELSDVTGYSLATISNTMKQLEVMGIVCRKRKPGTRKVFFYTEKNVIAINKRKIEAVKEHMMKPIKKKLPRMISKYEKRRMTAQEEKKIDVIKDYYRQIRGFERILDHVLEDLDRMESRL